MDFLNPRKLFPHSAVRPLAPYLVGIGGLLITLSLWRGLVVQDRVQTGREVQAEAEKIHGQVESEMQARILALVRLARRWDLRGKPDVFTWEFESRLLKHHYDGFQAIYWADSAYIVRWSIPDKGGNFRRNMDLRKEARSRLSALLSAQRRQVMVTRPISFKNNQKGFMALVPLFHKQTFGGFQVGEFNFNDLFSPMIKPDPLFAVRIVASNEPVYGELPTSPSSVVHRVGLNLYGTSWQVEVAPTAQYFADRRSYLPEAVLGTGAILSLLLGLTLFLIQEARRRARELALSRQFLEKQTHILQSVLDNLGEGVVLTDLSGHILMQNPAAMRLMNADLTGELVQVWLSGLNVYRSDRKTLYKTEDLPAVRALRGETADHEELYVSSADGSIDTWMSVTSRPLMDAEGLLSGAVALFADITARKRSEEQLHEARSVLEKRVEERTRELQQALNDLSIENNERMESQEALADSEGRYRFLANAIPHIVWTAEADGLTDYYNDRWTQYTGLDAHESYAVRWTTILHEEDMVRVSAEWEKALEQGIEFRTEARMKRASDGIYRWHLLHLLPLRGDDGYVVKWFATATDIDEQKRLEVELVQAKDLALAAAAAKTNFLANISHEIRTPINGIIGTTGLLIETPLSPEQREYASILFSSGESLLAIINDLLDLSKIEAGKLSIENTDFDLSQTIETAIGLFAESVHLKKLELITFVAADSPNALRGDPTRLRQVLTNLISNAIKYTEKGEVVVRVTKETESRTRARLRFEVQDTGIGVTPEQQAKLFEPFYQVDSSASRVHQGTGLGLAICRQLVELMGGQIGLESVPQRGSTFWFSIPFEKQSALEIPVSGPPLKVLVVDESEANRNAVGQRFEAWKMSYQTAATNVEAQKVLLEAAAKGRPFDIVLIDLKMPRMEGLVLAGMIKSDLRLSSARIVIMATIARHVWDDRLRSGDVAAFLTKPLLSSQLFECLQTLNRQPVESPAELPTPGRGPRRHADGHVIRILLAEDNMVNQTVALRQLERLGYVVDSSSNGQEALDALTTTDYDVILMDCQMPVMDGYQATAEIRKREQGHKHTIIIAMTAHALKEDREKCLAAGMDDYLSKPVKPVELDDVLERWIRQGLHDAPVSRPTQATAKPDIDVAQLEATLGLKGAEGSHLVQLYLDTTEKNLAELKKAIRSKKVAEVERLAHSAAGANAMVGMNNIALILRKLESSAKDGSLEGAMDGIAQLEEQFARAKRYLEENGILASL